MIDTDRASRARRRKADQNKAGETLRSERGRNQGSPDNLWWVGNGGLLFGKMYAPSEIIVPVSDANPTEVEDASEDGWAVGEVNGVTFPTGGTEHYLTVPVAGRWAVLWDMSAHTNVGGRTEVHGGVMVDGVAQRDDGESHRTVTNTQDTGAFGSDVVVDVAAGAQISLWIINNLSNDMHIVHANMFIQQIAG